MGARWPISTRPTDGTTQSRLHGPGSLTPTSITTNRLTVIPPSLPPSRKQRVHSGASGGRRATATPHLYRIEDRRHILGCWRDAAEDRTTKARFTQASDVT